ncbi:zinc finger BED domain-containing protein RICESLEEPER 1-like [Pistacia vera]|uniref:zinc finger BED domain-containing protein RICESLEEPER 1-like n=1 Tax=Pistacia vera TaxID=55513 RepID=UPI001262C200|nr:zinc finger BED domain-containing protein RICESLEEPER 1-like [Pistacia vera]
MHEHPFTVVEDEGFNMMQKCGMSLWEKITRTALKQHCVTVYEIQKKKLVNLLKSINKISLTIDLWNSSNQKLEYMVVTGHFIDNDWKLQKRVLNFVHILAPRLGVEIAIAIHKCLIEWGIENKVFSISVDNASSNEAAIKILRENLGRNKKLMCGGRLFHQLETRAIMFVEIVQMLQLPKRKLILDCKTKWNSTYQMLTLAIQYKDVFPMLVQLDNNFTFAPIDEDWEKLKKVCEILEDFNSATNVISGSEYPTSNIFLQEIVDIKELLDEKCSDDDDFIRSMVGKMKEKFDKYWGECNFIMAIAAVLDPRMKMRMLQFAYPQMYPHKEAQDKIDEVQAALYEIYEEYAAETQFANSEPPIEINKVQRDNVQRPKRTSSRFCQFVRTTETVQHEKSKLDRYLEEKCLLWDKDDTSFDALQWWKVNQTNYRILFKMVREILAIPITTVASEATFSAGSRVIDTYQSSSSPDTVQMLSVVVIGVTISMESRKVIKEDKCGVSASDPMKFWWNLNRSTSTGAQEMLNLAVKYSKAVQEEDELPPEKLAIANVARQDAKKHLEEHVSNLMSSNIVQTLGTMLDTVVF